ncbi:ABC transporter permease [Paenibacillus abyssi]|uniref:Diguanylate cyclase n=1 Tax=Paenibacillus abyssi TaxID=1340531 RepID=A0A917CXY4_9BACL|nr:ABC transporter permease [Paenibacillus abyssi]GGG03680.1 diguanylate cyclase [Paenibacillus abyssi]
MSIAKERFQPLAKDSQSMDVVVRPSINFWQDAWRRLKKNKLAMAGLIILVLLLLMAIFAPLFSKFSYYTQYLDDRNVRPNGVNFFGTDEFGRDLWTRVWWGARISLLIGFVAAAMDLVIGVLYGGISAYYGGKVDDVMQRIIEIIYSIPFLLVAILLLMIMGPGIFTIVLAYAVTGWVNMARLVRGQVLALKEQEFVLAARTLGGSPARLILKHLIPNALGIIIVQITFTVPNAIFFESFLSFLGLGIRVPMASLGYLLSDGANVLLDHPHRLIFPTLVFSLILLSFNLLGDGLRDALDPKMRK